MQLPLWEGRVPRRKRCSKCRELKPLEAFNRRTTAPDGRQWMCRECNSEYHSENKARHNAQIHARTARIRAENQERIRQYLLGRTCTDCGHSDIRVLEFDHLRDKVANVSLLVSSAAPWKVILEEIEKCEVVCANCHRIRTYERRNAARAAWIQ